MTGLVARLAPPAAIAAVVTAAAAGATATSDRWRMRSLILMATGTAAWREIGRVDRIAARDLHGKRRVLDSGTPGSLRDVVLVRGTTAQWRSNAKLRHRRIDQLGR